MTPAVAILSFAISVPLAALGWLAGCLFDRTGASPVARHGLWQAAFWAAPGTVLAALGVAFWTAHSPAPARASILVIGALTRGTSPAATPSGPTMDLAAIVLGVIIAGAGFRLVWLASRLRSLHRIAAATRPLTGDVEAAIRARLGAAPRLRLRASDAITSPLLVGLRRPIVLLPARLATPEASEAAALVCRHEVEHVRRGDNLRLLLEELVLAAGWFNPALYAIRTRLMAAREEARDAAATDGLDAPSRRLYAATLVESLQSRTVALPAVGLIGLSRRHAAERVAAILAPKPGRRRTAALIASLCGLGLTSMALTGFAAAQQPVRAGATHESTTSVSTTTKIAIESDEIITDDARGVETYKGHVRFISGDYGPSVRVFLDGKPAPGVNLSSLPVLALATFHRAHGADPARLDLRTHP